MSFPTRCSRSAGDCGDGVIDTRSQRAMRYSLELAAKDREKGVDIDGDDVPAPQSKTACGHCGRMVWTPCRNTRDMDPVDGFNNDGGCHAALIRLGGGERGRTLIHVER